MRWLGILKPYHMLNNLFKLIALKGSEEPKTLGASTRAQVRVLELVQRAHAHC